MKTNSHHILILLIILILFPSVCFSEDDNAKLRPICKMYYGDVINYLHKQNNKSTLGLIIDVKKNLMGDEKEKNKDTEEESFYKCLNILNNEGNKIKLVDRRLLGGVLEEQKLSSSGITDFERQKLGRILNIDFILLEQIYDYIMTQQLLKVDTGEILVVKTVEFEKKEDKWVHYLKHEVGNWYYNTNYTKTNQDVVRVWNKVMYNQIDPEGDEKKLDNTKYLREVDCHKGSFTYISQVEYNDNEEVLKTYPPDKNIYRIIPGTNMDTLLKKVCE